MVVSRALAPRLYLSPSLVICRGCFPSARDLRRLRTGTSVPQALQGSVSISRARVWGPELSHRQALRYDREGYIIRSRTQILGLQPIEQRSQPRGPGVSVRTALAWPILQHRLGITADSAVVPETALVKPRCSVETSETFVMRSLFF